MKKEDLIEKYPELVAEIAKEFTCRVILSNDKNAKELWNEYLEENKPKNQDFKVLGLKLPHYSELWLNEKTNHFCGIDGKNVIEYEKGLLLGEVFSVKYKNKQFSIGDVVQYLDKTYQIQRFVKERAHLKLRNGNYYYEPHISEISRLKPLGVTEDGFNLYNNDNVSWVYNNSVTDKYEYCYELRICSAHFEKGGSLDGTFPFKIFYNKENALKFIEENNKKMLFLTTDNVQIFDIDKEQTLYLINHVNCAMIEIKAKDWDKTRLIYASKQKAEEYVLNHSKVFSYAEISHSLDSQYSKEYYLNLVKERLNQK